MKFILNEGKFKLNECRQFLLEERLTLQEATAADVALSWTKKLKGTFDNTEAVLKKYIEYAGATKADSAKLSQYKELQTKFNDTTQELENTMELPVEDLQADNFVTAKADLTKYVDVLNQIKMTVVPTEETNSDLYFLEKQIKNLNILRTRFGQWKQQDSDSIKKILKWATEKILPTFDTTDLESGEANVESFKQLCTECLKLIEDFKTNLPEAAESLTELQPAELKDYYDPIVQIVKDIQLPVAEKLNKGLVVANIKKYQAQLQTLRDCYSKIEESTVIEKIKAAAKAATDSKIDLDNSSTDKEDWKSKLASAINKDNIIQQFIYTTWPKDSDRILKIKDALLQECEAYGFEKEGSAKNPFITFIPDVYLKYGEVFTPEKYNTIHNLVVSKSLTGKDLAGEGAMGKGNLVFCKALYSLDSGVIKLYIKKQHNLLTAANRDAKFSTNAEMAFNALYNVSTITTGKDTNDSTSQAIRPMNQVEQLEAKWTGTVSDTAAEPSKKIATNAQLIQQIATTEKAVNVLATLAIKFSTSDKITATVQSCTEAKELMSKTTTVDGILKLVASTERLYHIEHIKADQAMSLIKSILESDQFNLTKE